ncbi:Hypothetical protein PBC10988_0290 [Planctomycetales bacterium 10988]|nr:Hypothetical protein PBC10988_0290 [Planctomycetales bacterium 10988]
MRVINYSFLLGFLIWVYSWSMDRYYSGTSMAAAAKFASQYFIAFSWLEVFTVLLVGPAMFAGTIAEERERRTIEYLFATDLSNWEIILGKLGSRFLIILELLFGGFPILSLAMLMGGIQFVDLLYLLAILLSVLLMVSGLSMVVSVSSIRARTATQGCYLSIIIYLALPIGYILFKELLREIGIQVNFFDSIEQVVYFSNPLYLLGRLEGAVNGYQSILYTQVMACLTVQACLFLFCVLISIFQVRRIHLREAGAGVANARHSKWNIFRRLNPLYLLLGVHRIRPRVGNSAMLWKEVFTSEVADKKRVWIYFVRIMITVVILGPILYWQYDLFSEHNFSTYGMSEYRIRDFCSTLAYLNVLFITIWLLLVTSRAATSVTSERERDTWLTILSTSLTSSEIIFGKLVGSIVAMWHITLLPLVIYGLILIVVPSYVIRLPLIFFVWLVLTFTFTTWGIFCSCYFKTSNRALLVSLGTSLFVGGGYLICLFPCLIELDEDSAAIFLSGLVPYVLIIPSVGGNSFLHGPDDIELILPGFVGVFFYAVVGVVLYATMIQNFDRWMGRTERINKTFKPSYLGQVKASIDQRKD